MNKSAVQFMRFLRKFIAPALIGLLAILLVATIYFTLFDLQWIAFLAGVLFAAVSALTSQTARAQWLIVRRTRQFERSKEQLAEEGTRRERAVKDLAAARTRMQLVVDALPVMIVFVDRDERCSHHNRAFEQWCGRSYDTIDGLPLHAVVSDEIYRDIKAHSADALAGKEIRYTAAWIHKDRGREDFAVTLLPYPPDVERKAGFYGLIERTAGRAATGPAVPLDAAAGNVAIVSQDGGETVYLQSMTEQLIGGSDPRSRLVQALEEDQFLLFAQKIEVLSPNAKHKRCVEVLLRLREEEDNMLPPGGFFPVAEHYNLMGEIDRWVVHNLLKWCAARRLADARWQAPLCCVNLSSTTLCDPGFPRYLNRQLEYFAMPPGSLCFEIAEADLTNHHAELKLLMDAIRLLGCRFTIDGFGGAKVSFAPLKELSFDFLKMDGAITRNILSERSDFARTKAIVLACEKLGIQTIAGFVESDDMLAKLREIGVDYAQGFGIGRPAPLAEVG